jgi:EAL domain-containing protein (putative c-di-GMP-specific phosphodiesterase class I)/PAS domain-containing protein
MHSEIEASTPHAKMTNRIAAAISPYTAAVGTGLLIAMMIATMSLTAFERQWVVFLSGILAAAVFALVSQGANARWVIARRTAQVSAMRVKLAAEAGRRADSEAALERHTEYMKFVDVFMPAMLAYVDAEGIVRYHNYAYARWIGRPDNAIDGHSVEEVVGPKVHAEIEAHLRDAMAGGEVRYERTHDTGSGASRLLVQYLPHFAAGGKVAGVFAILTDVTRPEHLAPEPCVGPEAEGSAGFAARLVIALERDEFRLYSQSITALGRAGDGASFCEVLLRLTEEEDNLLPPGSFLPVAEEHGLLPAIDRWVVRHVLDVACAHRGGEDAVYFINICAPTVIEGTLAEFVRAQLALRDLGGAAFCFEFPEADVLAHPRAYAQLFAALAPSGCRFAVSGVGADPAIVGVLAKLGVNYLKLDGGLVFNMMRDAAHLGTVRALNDAAHNARMQVVAQCVENESTRRALQAMGVDFAQGFGISMPKPMAARVASYPRE